MKRMHVHAFVCSWVICLPFTTFSANVPQSDYSTLAPASHNALKKEFSDLSQKNVNPNALFGNIQDELKKPIYRQEILPNDFSYFVQLISHANKTKQPRECIQSIISLFSNLLKGSQYVNAYAFSSLMDQLPGLLKDHFMLYTNNPFEQSVVLHDLDLLERFSQVTTSMMYSQFKTNYSNFKTNPEQFLDELSGRIAGLAEEEVSVQQLRQSLVKFLEVALGKLIWNPHQHAKTWDLTKKMSHQLAQLLEHNILGDETDLDDLFWSVIHRYCFFIDVTSLELPIAFYERVRYELATQQLLLFDLEEQETFIESKSECFKRTLFESEARKRAFDKGIIS